MKPASKSAQIIVKLLYHRTLWFFRYPLRTAVAVAAGLTQIGELSFVVVQVARLPGLVDESVFSTVIAASLISILLNVFGVRSVFRWIERGTPETFRSVGRFVIGEKKKPGAFRFEVLHWLKQLKHAEACASRVKPFKNVTLGFVDLLP
jgi:hypothetical protein